MTGSASNFRCSIAYRRILGFRVCLFEALRHDHGRDSASVIASQRVGAPRRPLSEAIHRAAREGWIASSHPPSPEGGLWRTRALLAMTGKCESAISRRNAPELLHELCPSKTRGRREGRVPVAPMAPCAVKKHRGRNHRCAGIIRPSLRNGFNSLYVLSPVTIAWLPPSPARRVSIIADLAPASERQNHTTSPSASCIIVVALTRLTQPTSTASHPQRP